MVYGICTRNVPHSSVFWDILQFEVAFKNLLNELE